MMDGSLMVFTFLDFFASYELEKGNNISEVEIDFLSTPLHFFQLVAMMIMRQRSR